MGSGCRSGAKKGQKQQGWWFSIRPMSVLAVALYGLCLLAAPLIRGRGLHWSDLSQLLVGGVLTLGVAVLLAWVCWRFLRQCDWFANAVLSGLLAFAGVWTIMTPPQRANAQQAAQETIEHQATQLKSKAAAVLD